MGKQNWKRVVLPDRQRGKKAMAEAYALTFRSNGMGVYSLKLLEALGYPQYIQAFTKGEGSKLLLALRPAASDDYDFRISSKPLVQGKPHTGMNKAFYLWLLSVMKKDGGLIKLSSGSMEDDMVVFCLVETQPHYFTASSASAAVR